MTLRDLGQVLLDAVGGVLVIVCAVMLFTYLPGLLYFMALDWLR